MMLTNIISIIIAWFPLLSVYRSFIPGVDIGTLLYLIFIFIFVCSNGKLVKNRTLLCLFTTYIFVFGIINLKLIGANTEVMLRLFRFSLLMFLFIFSDVNSKLNYRLLYKSMANLIYINSSFIVIQYFFKIDNPLINLGMRGYNSGYVLSGRPSGFFMEPSHCAQYIVIFLVLSFFSNRISYKEILFSMLGILFSTSGMGVVLAGFLVIVYFVRQKVSIKKIIFFVIALVALYVFLHSDMYRMFYDRVFTEGISYGGNALEARIGYGFAAFSELSLFQKFFGRGYGNIPEFKSTYAAFNYLNGLTYSLNTIGIVGLVLYLCVNISLFMKRVDIKQSLLLIVNLMIFLIEQNMTATNLIFILGIYYAVNNNIVKND